MQSFIINHRLSSDWPGPILQGGLSRTLEDYLSDLRDELAWQDSQACEKSPVTQSSQENSVCFRHWLRRLDILLPKATRLCIYHSGLGLEF